MKRLFSFVAALGTVLVASAQLTSISIEPVLEHDGQTEGLEALGGYTTYHIYANLTNELDFVSAVYGDAESPMILQTTGDIFQSTTGTNYGASINGAFLSLVPELAYDSWFTIDATFAGDLDGTLQGVFGEDVDAISNFENGNGFVINDPIGGSWFTTWPCVGAADLAACAVDKIGFAGSDLKVLLAQITTNGDLSGTFNVQVFPDGNQDEDEYAEGFDFSSILDAVFGCTDADATNYNPAANTDDASCVFPCTLQFDESTLTVNSPVCSGGNTGSIQIEATGAQLFDDFTIDNNLQVLNFGSFTQLISGPHIIYVTDGAGCADTLEVDIPATPPLELTAEVTTPVTCHDESDGIITVTSVTGGSGNYEYSISSNPGFTASATFEGLGGANDLGAVYQFTVMDMVTGCISEPQPSDVQTGSSPIDAPGTYVSNPLEVEVFQDNVPNPVVPATCVDTPDGELWLVATGGGSNSVGPWEFSVDDGVSYGSSPLSVAGGTYTIIARDVVLGCTGTFDDEVFVGPRRIEVNASTESEVCVGDENGQVSWNPEFGTGAFTYDFDGVATTEEMAMDLAPGTYTVTVTDDNGCSESETVEVEAAVAIAVSTTVEDASCYGENDGAVTVNATGGSGTFQYSEDGTNFIQNNMFGGLTADSYVVFVQDEFGCEESGTAVVGEPDSIAITAFPIPGADGEAGLDVTVLGGNPPYEYEWIGDGVNGADTQDLDSLFSGIYILEVTDASGCSSIQEFDVTTDLREIEEGVVATVYPNPSQGLFVVDILGGFQGQVQYQVVDARGRQMLAGQWNAMDGFFRTQLDLSSAQAGMYRLVMLANGRPSSLQLVKTN